MKSKVELNKKEKEDSLFQAGYDLFLTKGIHNTAINDIVKKAGVAKGTFYLYFKDKYDLLDRIILNKSAEVLCEAIKNNSLMEFQSFEDEVLNFVNYIIEYFKEDKLLLKLIYKNLSWGTFKKAYNDYEEIHDIYKMFQNGFKDSGLSHKDVQNLLFIIIELTGSVCYSAIILEEPSDIEEIKPILFDTIRKII